MTVDDDSSIYVGGLPYDATEETLRRVFDIYGAVLAVKIINDRTVGGKCYGFVTFTNPRSAMHAINEMDGKTIDGRVVRVNDVKSRGGRSNFGRESFRRNSERSAEGDRGRVREKLHDERDHYRDARRDRSRDRDQDRQRGYDRIYDHDRIRDQNLDRARVQDRDLDMEYVEHEHERDHDRDWEKNRNQDMGHMASQRDRSRYRKHDKDRDEMRKSLDGSNHDHRSERDFSSRSNDSHDQFGKQLEIAGQKLEDLQKEISLIEELAEEKKHLVSNLQEKSQKLEDALTAAKKVTSHRLIQLTKLHKCYTQVREYNERLKNSEQELQSFVDSTTLEVE